MQDAHASNMLPFQRTLAAKCTSNPPGAAHLPGDHCHCPREAACWSAGQLPVCLAESPGAVSVQYRLAALCPVRWEQVGCVLERAKETGSPPSTPHARGRLFYSSSDVLLEQCLSTEQPAACMGETGWGAWPRAER